MKVTSYLDIGRGFDGGCDRENLSDSFDALARAVADEIYPPGDGGVKITVAFTDRGGDRWKIKGRADTLPDAPEPAEETLDPTPGHGTAIVTRDGSPADPADGATLVAGLKTAAEAIKVGLGGDPYQVEPMLTATATDNAGCEWKVVANLTQPATVQLTAHEINCILDDLDLGDEGRAEIADRLQAALDARA